MIKFKVATIVGTRPEIIRLSRIISLVEQNTKHILIHTGQNYDEHLNHIFFKDLKIREPDYKYSVSKTSLASAISDIFKNCEKAIAIEKPDAVLILGDTNSCLSSIIAKRMRIPVYHLEAGNRCFDENVPEEINRRIIDHVSDFNLVYTEHARRNLLAEGLHPRRIHLIGSPMNEVIQFYMPKIKKSSILNRLNVSKGEYFVASFHREENVDNVENLKKILDILNTICDIYGKKVIVTTHPRTKKQLEKIKADINNKIIFCSPFCFTDYIWLQKNSKCVLSDSGTVSEECAIIGFNAITIRNSIERPEAIESGVICLSELNERSVINIVDIVCKKKPKNTIYEYNINDTSERVLKIIAGTCKLSNMWWGLQNV